jgi:ABC-type lipoprotein release transport system permease subunit
MHIMPRGKIPLHLLLHLAVRNLLRSKKRSLITISSVFFAVLLALIAESINEGSHESLIDTTVKLSTGYIQIADTAYLRTPSLDLAIPWNREIHQQLLQLPFPAHYVPRIQNFMLAAGERKTSGSLVQGIDPDAEDRFNGLRSKIIRGALFDTKGGAVLGRELADYLQLDVGDTIVLIGQGFQGSLASGKYHIAGIVKLNIKELNKITVFLPLNQARELLDMPSLVTHALVEPLKSAHTQKLAHAIQAKFSTEGITALTWQQLLPELLQALAFDTISNRVLLGILYVVVGFGIFGTVLTMTLERTREFGILISIGMKRRALAYVLAIETFFLGLSGVLAGIIVGLPVLLYMKHHPIPLGGDLEAIADDFGIEPMLYFSTHPSIFAGQGLVILLICSFIALYPYRYVMKLNFLKAAKGE